MIPLPNLLQPFVSAARQLQSPWNMYLQQFTQAPPNIQDVTVTTSPFEYQAKEPGNVSVIGGTVSAIALVRGLISVDVTGMKLIPVAINDIVRVTYSVLPTIKFLASYGQNTGAQ
jgi:hypothetical protein